MEFGIKENILRIYRKVVEQPNNSYLSWEHCYLYFQKRHSFKTESHFDIASLHLTAYLASWGMYRGSSKLPRKDYKIHVPIVYEILDSRYKLLWGINLDVIEKKETDTDLFFDLVENLRSLYDKQKVSPTDTLITKVLLGTVCCAPAYDRFFIDGVKTLGEFPALFGRKSYLGVIKFCQANSKSIQAAQSEIAKSGVTYPVMKLVDMYFFTLGYLSNGGSENDFV